MNTASASHADRATNASLQRPILVWDLPVRVFHWSMVLCFAGAWLTGESERWRLLHVTLGYTMAGLVAFRVVWGLVGTRHARFASFVRGPATVARYLRSLVAGTPEHHTGHNPAGAWAIVILLTLAAMVTASGWAQYNDLGGKWLEEFHEFVASTMLAVVGVHLVGVLGGSLLHGENLVRSMLTGRKAGPAGDGVRRAWRSVGALMIAAMLAFWWVQWQSAPASGGTGDGRAAAHGHDLDDDD